MYDAPRGTVSGTGGEPAVTARVGGNGRYLPAVHWLAVVTACSTLLLICSGGMVTSKNAGLAVPDWPNTYGYNMFAFPVSRWVGAVLLEHTHRLAASGVGMLTVGLMVTLAWVENRRWLRTLGYVALALVIVQGVLGGLRVRLVADWIGIFHGCVAQAFLALVSFIALATSRWWLTLGAPNLRRPSDPAVLIGLAKKLLVVAVLIYGQLALGAAMRHAHAGLSIPDFPTAYGHWWPQVHKADLPALNHQRTEALHQPPTTLAQIHLQMIHRLNATLILGCIVAVAVAAWRRRRYLPEALCRLATAGLVLVALQITLGIFTIWTNKAADIATAHVAVGASLLVWAVLTYAALRRWMTGGESNTATAILRSPQPEEALA